MAIYTIQEKTLTDIANVIREKTGSTQTFKPTEMADAIGMVSGKMPNLIDGSITQLSESDFGSINTIRTEAFWQCASLTDVRMPDTITLIKNGSFNGCSSLTNVKMSKNVGEIQQNAFAGCSKLKTLRLETVTVPKITADAFPTTTTFEVSGKMYDLYLGADNWGTVYKTQIRPITEYVATLSSKTIMEYNSNKAFSLALQNYSAPPDINVKVSNPAIVEVVVDSIDTNTILFSIFSLTTEGSATVSIEVPGEEGFVFTRSIDVEVLAELQASTYTVENISGITYGFELNDAGYYESTNKGVQSSFAYCKINISNMMGYPVYIDCISYGENNYDYGLLSAVNADLSKDINTGTYLHSMKGLSSPNVNTYEYLDAIGDCYITVKYRKDGSGDNNKDTLQFKVRFGE